MPQSADVVIIDLRARQRPWRPAADRSASRRRTRAAAGSSCSAIAPSDFRPSVSRAPCQGRSKAAMWVKDTFLGELIEAFEKGAPPGAPTIWSPKLANGQVARLVEPVCTPRSDFSDLTPARDLQMLCAGSPKAKFTTAAFSGGAWRQATRPVVIPARSSSATGWTRKISRDLIRPGGWLVLLQTCGRRAP